MIPLPAQRGERALLGLAALAVVLKVAFHAGAPRLLLTAALWAAALLAVALTLGGPRTGRWIDGWRLLLVLLALGSLPEVYGRVGGDGIQYYVLLRSPVLDHDFDLGNDFEGLGAPPVLSFDEGTPTSRMPIGTALLWLPPFLLTHLVVTAVSWLPGMPAADGFGPVYQATVTTATFVYCVAALLLLEGALRRRFGPAAAALAVIGTWLATPLFFYMVANPSMSHGASAAAATAFVLCWLRAREEGLVLCGPGKARTAALGAYRRFAASPPDPQGRDLHWWIAAGVWGGLLVAVRPQDAVFLALPVLDLLRRGRAALRPLGALAIGPAAAGLVQVLVWLRLYGADFAGVISRQSYVGHTALAPFSLLFSARHGFFVWTPIALLAVLGWLAWLRRDAWLGVLMGLGFTLAVLVNSAMQDWWGSESFGQRRLLGLTPLLALGLAAAFALLRRRPLLPLLAGLLLLVAWNRQLAAIYNSEALARRNEAISLDQLAAAQVDAVYRKAAAARSWLPAPVWLLLYDNLKGIWLDEGPRSLEGVIDVGQEPRDLPEVLGHNWYRVLDEGDVTYRRSRGRRSWLRVPIRTPAPFVCVCAPARRWARSRWRWSWR